MKSPALPLLLAAAALLATPVQAQETLKPGQVACLSRKAAEDFQAFQTSAPAFAEDLLARATCYKIKDETPAVRRSGDETFAQYQLLSGHKVWLPK